MERCSYCRKRILSRGVDAHGLRFCGQQCAEGWRFSDLCARVPAELLEREVWAAYQGGCPQCHGPGPVDVYTGYRVWSALVWTQWSSWPRVLCRSCGRRSLWADAGYSLVLGWWGFPFGLIMTPVQVWRNFAALFRMKDTSGPSSALRDLARRHIAGRAWQAEMRGQTDATR